MLSRRQPSLAVDVIISSDAGVVLIKRGHDPYKGMWALPGGFVRYGEKVENAAVREAREETGLRVRLRKVVGVYSNPKRDPRGHVVSVCFLGEKVGGGLKSTKEVMEAQIFEDIPWKKLAFDHARMLRDAGLG